MSCVELQHREYALTRHTTEKYSITGSKTTLPVPSLGAPPSVTTIYLPLRIGDKDAARASFSDDRAVEAVDIQTISCALALLCVTVENHVVGQHLSPNDGQFLSSTQLSILIKLNRIIVSICSSFFQRPSHTLRTNFCNLCQVTGVITVVLGYIELEITAEFRTATEEART